MEPLGDLKVKSKIDLIPFPIKEEPNVDANVEENMEVLTDMQEHASEWKMGSEQSVGNHSRYDPEENNWRSEGTSVNNDRESRIDGDESEKDCKVSTFGLNASSSSQDAPPEFEKVFVKVENVYSSDEESVEQEFWVENPSVGQEPQAGCSSWSDEVDLPPETGSDSTLVNSKGGSHQHKEFVEDRSGACNSPVTDYPEADLSCAESEKDCKTSNIITLNNTLTKDEVYACGFERKEHRSIPVEVLEKTRTSVMKQFDKEMIRGACSKQSLTQSFSQNRLRNYVCEICNFKTPISKVLEVHVKEHSDEKRFHCQFCGYRCSKSSDIKNHERSHTGEKPFSCKFCGYKFSRSSHLKVHERIHTAEKPFHCEFCDDKFSRSSSLKYHIKTHTKEKSFHCKFCDYKCSRSSVLKVHEKSHLDGKPLHCKFCDYKCCQSSSLKSHERTHTGEKPFQCKFCDYKSSQSSSLKSHERSHSGEKPYGCEFCDFKCSRSSHLKVHKRIHTGEKPFHCKVCDFKCAYLHGLRVHERIHTGEKPFHCKFCDYKSSQSSRLKVHERIHSGEKPYQCEFCDYKCIARAQVTRHQRIHTKSKILNIN